MSRKIPEVPFLIEIGCEEIPASFLEPASSSFLSKIKDFFEENSIGFRDLKSYFTPRRIAIAGKVRRESEPKIKEIQGPPKSAGIGANGEFTLASIKFAESHKATIKDLYVKSTEKGDYIFLTKKEEGKPTKLILEKELPKLLSVIPFPKTMRWKGKERFARPVRWICALLGKEKIEFEFAGVKSSNFTFSNRFYSKNLVMLKSANLYQSLLKRNYVLVDFEERKKKISELLHKTAKELNGRLIENEELLEEVTNLVEYPDVVTCEINKKFLALPKDILITALAHHQRAFSIKDSEDKIMNKFMVIINNPWAQKEKVKPWFERMVTSRLEDAEFYIETDLKKGLVPLIEEEKKVTWIEGLGSLYDKTQRLIALGKCLLDYAKEVSPAVYERAALLSKTDLLTNLVREKEFTSLQGVVGKEYAEKLGEDVKVAKAIHDQYLPKTLNDLMPETIEGSLLSIADKVDNIYASFLKGEVPKGSRDPFGLRRQAQSIFSVVIEKKIQIDLYEIFAKGAELFKKNGKTLKNVWEFIKGRIKSFFIERGYRYDVVEAVLAVQTRDIYDAQKRMEALWSLWGKEEFEKVVIGQKRLANILREVSFKEEINENLFEKEEEKRLYNEAKIKKKPIEEALKNRDYEKVLLLLLKLRNSIDKFFDNVFVMTEDKRLRDNRLALLSFTRSLFIEFADFTKIAI